MEPKQDWIRDYGTSFVTERPVGCTEVVEQTDKRGQEINMIRNADSSALEREKVVRNNFCARSSTTVDIVPSGLSILLLLHFLLETRPTHETISIGRKHHECTPIRLQPP